MKKNMFFTFLTGTGLGGHSAFALPSRSADTFDRAMGRLLRAMAGKGGGGAE